MAPSIRKWRPAWRGLCLPQSRHDMVSPVLPIPLKTDPFSRLRYRKPFSAILVVRSADMLHSHIHSLEHPEAEPPSCNSHRLIDTFPDRTSPDSAARVGAHLCTTVDGIFIRYRPFHTRPIRKHATSLSVGAALGSARRPSYIRNFTARPCFLPISALKAHLLASRENTRSVHRLLN
jgi:hypothetical protein